jgi:hypothetical protein
VVDLLINSVILREYFVDLLGKPGALSQPDSSLNCTSSILVSSPLSHPRFKSIQTTEDFRTSAAKLYFLDCQPLNLVFDNPSSGDSLSTSGIYNIFKKHDRWLWHLFVIIR